MPQQYDPATGRLIHVLELARPCATYGCGIYDGHPGEHEFACTDCAATLTPDNEFEDREAKFWLGDKRDRYCVKCADRLAEAQYIDGLSRQYAS